MTHNLPTQLSTLILRLALLLSSLWISAPQAAAGARAWPSTETTVSLTISSTTSSTFRPTSPLRESPPQLTGGTFAQVIDHTVKSNPPTFAQRYWVDSEFAHAGPSGSDAPVIYHICGESNAEDGYFLDDNARAWAKELGAHLVYLEHRYYGLSLPFADLSTEHLHFLTLGNVIEDLAAFQKWLSRERGWRGKWLAVGGSYSGTLAAIYRQNHPELVVGALAASAPMISGLGEYGGSLETVALLSSPDPKVSGDGRPWAYQSCTTFGFWTATGFGFTSTLISPSAWFCQQLFGKTTLANSHEYNNNYDYPFLDDAADAPSNIFFTYGSEDVWTQLGLNQQSNANSKIRIRLIIGAGHHFDLNFPLPDDSDDVVSARKEFLRLAKTWLK